MSFQLHDSSMFRLIPAAKSERNGSRLACRSAFSLVELMIVLAILSVIAAMVVPNLQRSFDKNEIRQAATELQQQIGNLQLESCETGNPIVVQFGWNSQQLKVWRLPALSASSFESENGLSNLNSSDGLNSNSANDSLGSSTTNDISSNASLLDALGGGAQSLDDPLSGDSQMLWQEAEIPLLSQVSIVQSPTTDSSDPQSTTPATNRSSSTATGMLDDSLSQVSDSASNSTPDLGTEGSPTSWSSPLVLTENRFQADQIIWLETRQWNCPLFFSAATGRITIGPIRSRNSATLDGDTNNQQSSGSQDETAGAPSFDSEGL